MHIRYFHFKIKTKEDDAYATFPASVAAYRCTRRVLFTRVGRKKQFRCRKEYADATASMEASRLSCHSRAACIRKSRFSFTPKFKGISVQRRIWSTRRRILNSQTREQLLHWNRAR